MRNLGGPVTSAARSEPSGPCPAYLPGHPPRTAVAPPTILDGMTGRGMRSLDLIKALA
jgi:hypothetical protein